jgi:hypothetical protein
MNTLSSEFFTSRLYAEGWFVDVHRRVDVMADSFINREFSILFIGQK